MKVRVTFTVEIDPEAWTLNYGVEGAKAIREDVQRYVENGVTDQFREFGILVEQ